MKICKGWLEGYPAETQARLRAACVELGDGYEIPAAEFARIIGIVSKPTAAPSEIYSGLDAEIKRATGATPCRGCGQ